MKNLLDCPKALIVDDDPVIAELLNTALEVTEIFDSIEKVSTVKQAEELLEKNCFGLLILDHHLPDGKGYDLLIKLRKNPNAKISNLPVIFTTGEIAANLENEIKSLSSVRFLPKPYIIENVVELILNLLKLT